MNCPVWRRRKPKSKSSPSPHGSSHAAIGGKSAQNIITRGAVNCTAPDNPWGLTVERFAHGLASFMSKVRAASASASTRGIGADGCPPDSSEETEEKFIHDAYLSLSDTRVCYALKDTLTPGHGVGIIPPRGC